MVSFRITKNGFIGSGTGSLQGTATHAITASSVAWNDVTEKPSTYPAAAHNHTGDHLKPASVTTTGDITVGGNLIVNGSQTVIKTKNLTVKDKLIEIASGSNTKDMIDGAGIQFGEASLNASIKYENSGSTGAFVSPIDIHAPNIDLSITSISALYKNLGSETQPIYLTTAGPQLAKKYSEAEVKSAGFATSAEKLSTSNMGGAGEPVYFENGKPVADAKTKGAVDWVTNNSESLLTPDEVIWKKGTGTDSAVRVLTGDFEVNTPSATETGSIAIGLATVASGMVSHAEGMVVTASGEASHAEGYNTVASGLASHAEGHSTTASGEASHAEGYNTTASGDYSHAEGDSSKASGMYSHAEGSFTVAPNQYEHAQGIANHNSTNQIFSVGAGEKIGETVTRRNALSVLVVPNSDTQINTASVFVQNVGGYDGTNPTPGTNDLATVINGVSSIWKKGTGTDSAVRVLTGDLEPVTPSATGIGAVAIGLTTTASGYYSHAEGDSCQSIGEASHAEGIYTNAFGAYSHAEGGRTTASAYYSHAEGDSTNASGDASHAEGIYTNAFGAYSHAEGGRTTASAYYSHAEGYDTIASNNFEHAQGMYNYTSSNQIFSVGAGESDASRRNAVSVLAVKSSNNKYTASVFVQNIGGYNGTNPTPGTNDLATVIGGLTSNAGTVTSVGVSAGTGITASVTNKTTTPIISISSAQAHTHSNKAVLDGITAEMTASWTSKQDAINDLATIKSNAANGQIAYGWGNHASAGYAKSGDIKTAIDNLVTASGSKWSTDTKVTAVGNHYTPEQSTAKAASAGSVISGIGLDAAGHVTSITSSNSISNATNATTATNLGVAGNTSASVAAAIAEKWTYNEDTIKDVVVNKAVSATKLVGTSGSVGVPVYIDAGVPKVCQANLVSLPLSSTGATAGTVTLAPGKVHNCGTLTGNLTINLDASSTDSHEAIYCCVFNMGSTLRTITLPTGVKVVENSADLDTTDVYYEINIMNNVAIIARTAAS